MFGAVAVVLVGIPAFTAQSAQANVIDHCYGTRVAKHRLHIHGTPFKMGRTELWYSPKSGGTSCVMTYNGHKGTQYTVAALRVGKGRMKSDSGYYKYYAGGMRTKHSNGKCVKFGGQADVGGYTYIYLSKRRHPKTGKPCH